MNPIETLLLTAAAMDVAMIAAEMIAAATRAAAEGRNVATAAGTAT